MRLVARRHRFFVYICCATFSIAGICHLGYQSLADIGSRLPFPHQDPYPADRDHRKQEYQPAPAALQNNAVGQTPLGKLPSHPTQTNSKVAETTEIEGARHGKEGSNSGSGGPESSIPSPASETSPPATVNGSKMSELFDKAQTYLPSILDPNNTSIDRMSCPSINETRYSHLRVSDHESTPKYFFALNLRECVDILPRLMGSLLEAIRFLGPHHCALSIVEGNSDDGTLEVLELLRGEMERLGTAYYLHRSTLNPSDGQRIEKLAVLRAMALAPITGITASIGDIHSDAAPERLELDPDATVIFLNDVAACAEDILELAHQRVRQGADMTCAMDWTHPGGGNPLFYDVWIARTIGGDFFFEIPEGTASWEHAAHLFPSEPATRSRLERGLPFQVFSCWNGAVAMAAAPLAGDGNGTAPEVQFRISAKGECFQGEPQLLCKDMWFRGHGKIAVVPSVNLQYTDALGRRVKSEKGYVSDWVVKEGVNEARAEDLDITWQLEPPELVKCAPDFKRQTWLPWNESLA